MMKEARSWSVWTLLVVVVLATTACNMGFGILDDKRTPELYLIPEGYVGWVWIDFAVRGAAGLPREGKYRVLRIPADGHLETSLPIEGGWAKDGYFYYNTLGKRRRIPSMDRGQAGSGVWESHMTNRDNGADPNREVFFVGSEQERHEAVKKVAPLSFPDLPRPSVPLGSGSTGSH